MSTNPRYLTKSRFKIGMNCPTQLYYTNKKDVYADSNLDDNFLMALAEGGFQVGELAKFLFSDDPVNEKITIEDLAYDISLQKTKQLLEKGGKVVIAEAAFQFKDFLIRTDIIVKEGNEIHLYEVKAKSWDQETNFWTKRGEPKLQSAWLDYLQDVAFQKYVLLKSMPGCSVKAHLILADKDAINEFEGLNQQFKIRREDGLKTKVEVKNGLSKKDLGTIPLAIIPVDDECKWIWENTNEVFNGTELSFENLIYAMADAYKSDIRVWSDIGKKCKSCQFQVEDETPTMKSGFNECWINAGLKEVDLKKPLIFELWGGLAGGKSYADKWLPEKKYFLSEITEEDVQPKNQKANQNPGLSPTERRVLQIEKSKSNDWTPYLDMEGLRSAMEDLEAPFHFIDFETTMVALPFHRGRKPYEAIAFQYSYHVMDTDGTIRHESEYLSLENTFPNYDFVRALKKDLDGKEGTIFRYHNHENTYLCLIYDQLMREDEKKVPDKEQLMQFIQHITHNKDKNWKGMYDMEDLYKWVLSYYYSPFAKGSNSIKQILPAVINDCGFIKEKYSRPIYGTNEIPSKNFKNHIWINSKSKFDPYKTLPPVIEGFENEELDKIEEMVTGMQDVNNGGAAMTAYSFLQFSDVPSAEKEKIRKSLLRYCELDTMAMVMIWEYWRKECGFATIGF